MNKDQLEKILDLARDYFISDISIIDCYNEYAEINCCKVIGNIYEL